jgi:hypothetical protein
MNLILGKNNVLNNNVAIYIGIKNKFPSHLGGLNHLSKGLFSANLCLTKLNNHIFQFQS